MPTAHCHYDTADGAYFFDVEHMNDVEDFETQHIALVAMTRALGL